MVPAREAAVNEVAYPGGETARRQRQAYPWIESRAFNRRMHTVFQAARRQAEAESEAEGYRETHTADRAAGRIEAPATSFWYGFNDDVVVRIAESDAGRTSVAIRSATRMGISDLGVNADRVDAFLTALEERLEG